MSVVFVCFTLISSFFDLGYLIVILKVSGIHLITYTCTYLLNTRCICTCTCMYMYMYVVVYLLCIEQIPL